MWWNRPTLDIARSHSASQIFITKSDVSCKRGARRAADLRWNSLFGLVRLRRAERHFLSRCDLGGIGGKGQQPSAVAPRHDKNEKRSVGAPTAVWRSSRAGA